MSSLLPPELLADILQNLVIADLLRASHTCLSWRVVARGCPVFWQDIRLAASSLSAADFFLVRLNQTDATGIKITLDHRSGGVGHLIMHALAAQISRVEQLSLSFFKSQEQAVHHILQQPAGCLRAIVLNYREAELHTLPKDLFGGHAPLLREIEMHSVVLPSLPIPALQKCSIVNLQLNHYPDYNVAVDLKHFPCLESITLDGSVHLIGPSELPNTLHEVFLDTTRSRYKLWFTVFPWLLHAAVVVIGEPKLEEMLAAVNGLPSGPLHIELVSSKLTEKRHPVQKHDKQSFSRSYTYCLSIVLVDSPDHRRTFQADSMYSCFSQGCISAFIGRIVTIEMIVSAIEVLVDADPTFTALTTLTLLWSSDQTVTPDPALQVPHSIFPVLQKVHVVPENESAGMAGLDCGQLVVAMRHLLGPTKPADVPVHLVIEGFTQIQAMETLQDNFASVIFGT
ncbi:hypothetical protein BKA62DRAFT_704269 [Auriculariales sp. MPI-PUGE-AT-0066]|nr:hypothetical protein BKA62DRAFT_704269 [Auriculariales sp. MPI-PUGE-AT-0066]